MHAELKFAEQKLRREMREELDLQLQLEQQRCSDKIAFMRSQVDAHIEQVRKASYAKAHNEIIKERLQQRAHCDASVDAAVSSTKSQHADELFQLNEMQRGYILRIQELQVENKSLHARNRFLTEAKDVDARKKEHELERDKQRDAQMIAGLEQQLKALQERLEGGGVQPMLASKADGLASSSRATSVAPSALAETLEDRMTELRRRSSALGQTLSPPPPTELKRQSSALSQKPARQALTDSILARETPGALDDRIGDRSGGDVAASTLDDPRGFFRRDGEAPRETTLTLDQLLGTFELEAIR